MSAKLRGRVVRKLWLKRRPIKHRWFGREGRACLHCHWGMTNGEWYRERHEHSKRRNRFVKRPWIPRTIDYHGRPDYHPLFEKPD
jgi:hypothetical protein